MITYEKYNLTQKNAYTAYSTDNLNWDTHFHRAVECAVILDGEINCTVDKEKYFLKKNKAVLIMPNQLHSFKTETNSRVLIIRFIPELTGVFYNAYRDKIPCTSVFDIEILPSFYQKILQPDNILITKALLYFICGCFTAQVETWTDNSKTEDWLLHKLIKYTEENYKNCSLRKAAAELGYDYAYISKYFLRHTGISFVQYLNNCKITRACELIKNTDMSMTQISGECGYETIRSFNRNFLKYMRTTPTQYRKSL